MEHIQHNNYVGGELHPPQLGASTSKNLFQLKFLHSNSQRVNAIYELLPSRWFITQPPPTPYPALQGSVLLLWVIWLYEPTVPPLGEDHGSDQVLVVNGLPVHGFSLRLFDKLQLSFVKHQEPECSSSKPKGTGFYDLLI